jgi:hypothetical protein
MSLVLGDNVSDVANEHLRAAAQIIGGDIAADNFDGDVPGELVERYTRAALAAIHRGLDLNSVPSIEEWRGEIVDIDLNGYDRDRDDRLEEVLDIELVER